MAGSDTVSLTVTAVKHESPLAILVTIDDEDYWVPKSQVHDDSEVYSLKSGPGTLVVARWWAKKEGLSED